jgi:hypothetical protein
MRHDSDDPAALTSHDRLRELGTILAEGIRRLRMSSGHGSIPPQIPDESGGNCLESSTTSPPHGTTC